MASIVAVTFRFNRRGSNSVGKIFMRLAEQAVRTGHTRYRKLAFRRSQGIVLA